MASWSQRKPTVSSSVTRGKDFQKSYALVNLARGKSNPTPSKYSIAGGVSATITQDGTANPLPVIVDSVADLIPPETVTRKTNLLSVSTVSSPTQCGAPSVHDADKSKN